ncbi:30S ribosomal protein S13 [Candidatus Bathyarchaeota archaeon]|nr:30S ribosomal protein S13 [Candidatus Bathyarchaeota archaeon]
MSEFKHIVRLLGKDLDGTQKVVFALNNIRGINKRLASALVRKANIPFEKRLGFLSDVEMRRLEETLANIENLGLPSWLLNRRKDLETGKDTHLTTADLDLKIKQDIERMTSLRSWKGYRHSYGLKTRGQRTRSTGRTGKVVGVKKKERAAPVGGS